MVYTHDKYGKPIPLQVQDILNRSVPVKPRKKRTASMASTRDVGGRSKLIGLGDSVPHISDVPELCSRSQRKVHGKRIPCESPLGNPKTNTIAPPKPVEVTSKTEPRPSTSPFSWFKSVLESVKSVTDSISEATSSVQELGPVQASAETEKAPLVPVKNDSPEWSGLQVLETFKVSEKPGYTPPTRAHRMNSSFYRILAMENAMCSKGKLIEPTVSMFIQPRSDPAERQFVLGIQQTLPRRRERRWLELTKEDFA